jgi:flagella basal body P-ring formation protein FlgA
MKTASIPAPGNHLWNNPEASEQPPLVHAGENVRVLRQEDTLLIEIRGVAEQNAGLGQSVRVRLSKVGIDVEQAQKEIVAVVSGPAAVEMQP